MFDILRSYDLRTQQQQERVAREVRNIQFDIFQIATESPGFAFVPAPIEDITEFAWVTRGLSSISRVPYLAQGSARQFISFETFYCDARTGKIYYEIKERYPDEPEPFFIMRGEVVSFSDDLD